MDQDWAQFRRAAKGFARLGVAADHMLGGDLGSGSPAVLDLRRMQGDEMEQVTLHAAVRRSYYGSVLRGAGESVGLLSSKSSLSRFAMLAARTGLESAAEMLWLYSSPDKDVRFARALDLLIAEEQDREGLVERGSKIHGIEVDDMFHFRDLAKSEGLEVREPKPGRGHRVKAAALGVPGKAELIEQATPTSLPDGQGRLLYSALSSLAHAHSFLSQEDTIKGSFETLRTDHFGAIPPQTALGLLVQTAVTITHATGFASIYLGQDHAPVMQALGTLTEGAPPSGD